MHLLNQGNVYIFWFIILPGRSEFTPLNRGKKNFRPRALFFGGGYIESENCFETLKGSTIE